MPRPRTLSPLPDPAQIRRATFIGLGEQASGPVERVMFVAPMVEGFGRFAFQRGVTVANRSQLGLPA